MDLRAPRADQRIGCAELSVRHRSGGGACTEKQCRKACGGQPMNHSRHGILPGHPVDGGGLRASQRERRVRRRSAASMYLANVELKTMVRRLAASQQGSGESRLCKLRNAFTPADLGVCYACLECGPGVWAWSVGLECGPGVWAWSVGLECGPGVWADSVGLARCDTRHIRERSLREMRAGKRSSDAALRRHRGCGHGFP